MALATEEPDRSGNSVAGQARSPWWVAHGLSRAPPAPLPRVSCDVTRTAALPGRDVTARVTAGRRTSRRRPHRAHHPHRATRPRTPLA
ncbi:hypothetical protein, partial [Streptomyces angustmyceticus]|uniref:hypothetical protein n=1 Tax=Streptomyces angustmyceticus TaxID=285578 RepID=UPI001ABF1530